LNKKGKGIVVNVLPRAILGADICMDPTSLPGRTNPGRVMKCILTVVLETLKK